MPGLTVHCAISRKRTRKGYEKLHKWIDDNHEDCGINHRSKNHFYDETTKTYIHKTFGGDEAVSEWLFHIVLDGLHTYYKNQQNFSKKDKNFMKFGFAKNGFIYFKDDYLDDDEQAWLDEFENYKEGESEGLLGMIGDAIFGKETGYCIHCGGDLEYNPKRPYCNNCYIIWKKYGDENYREKYCHRCGEKFKSALKEPLCKNCEEEE